MKLLAAADALMSLSEHRRQQVWDAAALRSTPRLLREAPVEVDYLEYRRRPNLAAMVGHSSWNMRRACAMQPTSVTPSSKQAL